MRWKRLSRCYSPETAALCQLVLPMPSTSASVKTSTMGFSLYNIFHFYIYIFPLHGTINSNLEGGLFMRQITEQSIHMFLNALCKDDKASGTIENYLRHIRAFNAWAGNVSITPKLTTQWRSHLLESGYTPGTINAMLVPLNRFFLFLGWHSCKVKTLRIQRQTFRDNKRELTKSEYQRLLTTALSQRRERLALLMEAICATGIRVSEAQYLTVETVEHGKAEISLKGKIRVILIPSKLRKKLLAFARKNKTASGPIFRTRNGNPLSRKQIWAEMKSLCQKAGVAASKVFPHNLRHLFARVFYSATRDIAKLADVLGHSNIETTRIYLISTGTEHERQLERLGLSF